MKTSYSCSTITNYWQFIKKYINKFNTVKVKNNKKVILILENLIRKITNNFEVLWEKHLASDDSQAIACMLQHVGVS